MSRPRKPPLKRCVNNSQKLTNLDHQPLSLPFYDVGAIGRIPNRRLPPASERKTNMTLIVIILLILLLGGGGGYYGHSRWGYGGGAGIGLGTILLILLIAYLLNLL